MLWAALAALLFLGTGAAYLHQDTPGTQCSICYAAHVPTLRAVPVRTPVAFFTLAWLLTFELLLSRTAPETSSASPRAPPA